MCGEIHEVYSGRFLQIVTEILPHVASKLLATINIMYPMNFPSSRYFFIFRKCSDNNNGIRFLQLYVSASKCTKCKKKFALFLQKISREDLGRNAITHLCRVSTPSIQPDRSNGCASVIYLVLSL